MAKKQTSIFGSFLVTCIGAITLGLLGMYFGYYEKQIQFYQTAIVDLQSRPTPEISLTFTVTQEEEPSTPSEKNPEEVVNKEKVTSKTDNGMSEQKRGVTAYGQKNDEKIAGRKRPVRTKPSQSDDSLEQKDEPIQRGPAFPRTRHSESDFDQQVKADDVETRRIPDIDDPEMDDNPLIRALREASRRQADNPPRDDDEPPPNPFEAILNIQDN
jgi:hypothetical protein